MAGREKPQNIPISGKSLRANIITISRKRLVLSLCLCLIGTQIHSQRLRDSLYLKDGSVFVGKIKNIKLGIITFDPDETTDVTVQLRKIKALAATSTVFRIETVGEQVYFGKLVPAGRDGYARLAEDSTTVLYLENISMLYRSHNAFVHRFSGNISLGYSYTKSSEFGRLNYDTKFNYRAKKEELSLSVSGLYDMTDTSFSRNREDLFIKNNYYLSPTWFVTGILGYQRNLQLSLLRRYQEGLGGGNKFITSRHVYAWSRAGVVLNQETSIEEVSSGTLAEAFAQVELNFFRFYKPKINLVTTQTIYYGLSQTDRFRNDGITTISWEVVRNFYLNLTGSNNYDSKPPVEGGHNFDSVLYSELLIPFISLLVLF